MHPQLLDDTFIHPAPGLRGRVSNRLAGCGPLLNLRRWAFDRLPFVTLESDVTDVVYLNWTVEAPVVRSLVPAGLKLWERDGLTLLTVLTYRHGHLGPSLSGSLRPLFGSPLQSNWRIYLAESPLTATGGTVLFIKNIMSSSLYALGARLSSDILPAHVSLSFAHGFRDDRYVTEIRGGAGSAPDLYCEAEPVEHPALPPTFRTLFTSWEEAVRFLCSQDFAVAKIPGQERFVASRIELPIDFDTLVPLQVSPAAFRCPCLERLVGDRPPLAYVLPRLKLRILSERPL